MGKIQAVIGANFGDEGKGRTVSWLCSQSADPLVVRHNSGAQAGHTVEFEGKRHVFSHFGSGTLQGVPTFLCHRFVANPVIFNQEWDELVALGVRPEVFLDSKCAMSTPLDMMLNQIREISRGANRHGSCGVGFGETIDRGLRGPVFRVRHPRRDIEQSRLGQWFLDEHEKIPLNGIDLPESLASIRSALWNGTFNWKLYWDEYDLMLRRVKIVHNTSAFLQARIARQDFIFEAAQGLALHQDRGLGAPDHATWSRTGIEDIIELLGIHHIEGRLTPYYVSRTYLTRHGNGPLPNAEPMPEHIIDETNKPNEWQGSLRYAPFDGQFTLENIVRDLKTASDSNRLNDSVEVLTCADQVSEITNHMKNYADLIFHSPRFEAPEVIGG